MDLLDLAEFLTLLSAIPLTLAFVYGAGRCLGRLRAGLCFGLGLTPLVRAVWVYWLYYQEPGMDCTGSCRQSVIFNLVVAPGIAAASLLGWWLARRHPRDPVEQGTGLIPDL